MSSGTRVRRPRTSRSIGRRFTVSGQMVEASTEGAAGFSFDNARVTPAQSSTATVTYTIRLIFLARALDGRCISIVFVHLQKSHAACPRVPRVSCVYSIVYTQTAASKTAQVDRKWE